MMNYFNDNEAALRYSRGRADFHHLITKRLKHFFGETFHIQHALDIACGTGLSTKALLPIAKQVFGTDASANMIKHAAKNSRIKFSIADAEQQPFTGNNFELITVCSGIHWFDIDKFLQETNRLLKTKGWLIIYDNFFIPELEKNTEFKLWHENYYLTKFPAPLRNSQYNWSNQHLKNKNFKLSKETKFKNKLSFTREELVLYLTTQSNVSSVVGNGKINYSEVDNLLDKELTRFFPDNRKQTFYFGNWIKYLQKLDDVPRN